MAEDAPKDEQLLVKPAPDDFRMYSVTTILGALDKPALVYWAATETAKAAVIQADYLAKRVIKEGEESVIKALSGARFQTAAGQRTAKDLGTAVHNALEQLALTGEFPEVDDEVRPFIEKADAWMQRFQPNYQAAEMTVYSPDYGYAGTLDAIATIDGVRFIMDYKTSRKGFDNQGKPTTPYPEQVGLQLAAYRYADYAATWRPRRYEAYRRRYYLLGTDERETAVSVPEVDMGLVIHLTPDHCEAYPINCDEKAHEAFLFTLECYRWLNDTSKHIMGAPLTKG